MRDRHFAGPKPLMCALAWISASCPSTREARSSAASTTLYSRLSPSERVSVTCIGSRPFGSLPYEPPGQSRKPARGEAWVMAFAEGSGAGGGNSNPHGFHHRNLNPARLPVPPRPRAHKSAASHRSGRVYSNAAAPAQQKSEKRWKWLSSSHSRPRASRDAFGRASILICGSTLNSKPSCRCV